MSGVFELFRSPVAGTVALLASLVIGISTNSSVLAAPKRGPSDTPCPAEAIAVTPGRSLRAAVDGAPEGAAFCLKDGVHRAEAVRPKRGQSFHGEGRTVLNGSRLLTKFSQNGRFWVAAGPEYHGKRHGECARHAPACNLPEAFFMDDKPLVRVLSMSDLEVGRFYIDPASGRLFFIDDPSRHKVEVTVAAFAFESAAPDVVIRNLTIEKYASVAQKGAIQAGETATGWRVENCEVRLNSGAGIGVANNSRVSASDIHNNGQIGITGVGRNILIANNEISANNTRGFDTQWEAGGVKLALSIGVILRGNHVHDNVGAGLWCDIDCRNIVYENNIVERNHGAGIFHEISFNATVRNNVVRYNGVGSSHSWYWGAEIQLAASRNVSVQNNTVTVSSGGCGIVLIDQSRPTRGGAKYKTRDNSVQSNELSFDGAACSGGVSDAKAGDENFNIITDGNNIFDGNVYHVSVASATARFPWGHETLDWDELRAAGLERNGSLQSDRP